MGFSRDGGGDEGDESAEAGLSICRLCSEDMIPAGEPVANPPGLTRLLEAIPVGREELGADMSPLKNLDVVGGIRGLIGDDEGTSTLSGDDSALIVKGKEGRDVPGAALRFARLFRASCYVS